MDDAERKAITEAVARRMGRWVWWSNYDHGYLVAKHCRLEAIVHAVAAELDSAD